MERVKKAKLNNSLEIHEALRYMEHFFGSEFDQVYWHDPSNWRALAGNGISIDHVNNKFVFGTPFVDRVVCWNMDNARYICKDSGVAFTTFDFIHKFCAKFHGKYTNLIKFCMKMEKIMNTDYVYTLKSILLILGTWRNSDFSLLGKDVILKICRMAKEL